MVDEMIAPKPGHKSIRVCANGDAWVEGHRCEDCDAVMVGATPACLRCGSRKPTVPFRAAETGKLFSWAIVHRSYPGIKVPFVSAVVDLDGGPTLKGTLRIGDLDAVRAELPVRLVIDDAGGAVDKAGAPYVGFHFVPEGIEA